MYTPFPKSNEKKNWVGKLLPKGGKVVSCGFRVSGFGHVIVVSLISKTLDHERSQMSIETTKVILMPIEVRDDPKLAGDGGEILISEWSGWRFDTCCKIVSLLDGKKH